MTEIILVMTINGTSTTHLILPNFIGTNCLSESNCPLSHFILNCLLFFVDKIEKP